MGFQKVLELCAREPLSARWGLQDSISRSNIGKVLGRIKWISSKFLGVHPTEGTILAALRMLNGKYISAI
jgi:hypothetical protein